MEGLIIGNISNTYKIKSKQNIYEAYARGKFKNDDITPLVGDGVEFSLLDNSQQAVIENILPRKKFIKKTQSFKHRPNCIYCVCKTPKARFINVR